MTTICPTKRNPRQITTNIRAEKTIHFQTRTIKQKISFFFKMSLFSDEDPSPLQVEYIEKQSGLTMIDTPEESP